MWCRRQKTGPSSSQQMSSSHPTRHKSDEKYTENLSIHIFNARVNVPRTRWLRARSVTWGTTGARRVSTSSWATAAWQVRNKMPTINVDMWKTHRKKKHFIFFLHGIVIFRMTITRASSSGWLQRQWTMPLWRIPDVHYFSKSVKEIYFQNLNLLNLISGLD